MTFGGLNNLKACFINIITVNFADHNPFYLTSLSFGAQLTVLTLGGTHLVDFD